MPRIFVIGALVYDIVFAVADWPAPNRAIHANAATLSPGGKGLNQAVAARRLGAEDVRLVGCVGDDLFGAKLLDALKSNGVNGDFVYRHPSARTSIAGIVVMDKTPGFVGAPDASRKVDAGHILAALSGLESTDILLVNFEIPQPMVKFALELGRAAGATNVLNPAPYFKRDSFVVDYMRLVDIIIPNQDEARLILGCAAGDLDTLARELQALGVGKAVLTIGDRGSILYDGSRVIRQPAHKLEAVDTSGASDAFVGAYCQGLALGWPDAKILELASAAAGLACTKRGTMTSFPHLREAQALLAAGPD